MKVLSGIVLYNPDLERLDENINAVIKQADCLILIDNGSKNISEIKKRYLPIENIELIINSENFGIAKALNQIMQYAVEYGYDWVLTLDQDSVCREGLIEKYLLYTQLAEVGLLSCNISDRNFQCSETCVNDKDYNEIRMCITSGSFLNTNAYQKTDGFDDQMFIDSVDFDFCIQLRKHGYKIYRVNYDGLLHEVGHGRNVKFFGKNYETYNHSPFRQYYMARNMFYLKKKYPDEYVGIKVVLRELKNEVLILFYEPSKLQKLKARWKGIKDSKNMNIKTSQKDDDK
ncbi:MAG: glycosyltransferase family 2 protein [Clostridia bacterium]|nr:glycosyltransferase family 2 protein [Clostridia bacterium]